MTNPNFDKHLLWLRRSTAAPTETACADVIEYLLAVLDKTRVEYADCRIVNSRICSQCSELAAEMGNRQSIAKYSDCDRPYDAAIDDWSERLSVIAWLGEVTP